MISKLLKLIGQHRKILLFVAFCFLFIPTVAHAQYSWDDHNKALADPAGKNKQKFDQQTFAGFINSANCTVIGCDAPGLQTGAITVTTEMIADVYANPPASGLAYIQDVIHRINPVQPAYAQTGTGFSRLAPLLPVWRAFRNFAYVAFAIVFVAIGLAVMFRMRLDPRTTLTIQSAIPRIVIGLLLVTFSYAIAGFVVDAIYVTIALVTIVFAQAKIPGLDSATLQRIYVDGSFLDVGWNLFTTVVSTQAATVAVGVGGLLGSLAGVLKIGLFAKPGPLLGIALGAALMALAIAVIILFLLVKLFLELIKAYISIIVAVILGPLQIALGTIPGLPGFGAWLKGLIANALVFPAVAAVLIIGNVLLRLITDGLWIPPMVGGGTLLQTSMPVILGIGILLIVHQVPQAIKNAFGVKGLGFDFLEAPVVPYKVGRGAYDYRKEQIRRQRDVKFGQLVDWLTKTTPGGRGRP